MIAILSPSKNMNTIPEWKTKKSSIPEFIQEASVLAEIMKKYSPAQLERLMKINSKLATLNAQRFIEWTDKMSNENASQAIMTFRGEVYLGVQAETLDEGDLLFSQEHLRILSGLYGILRPLDLIRPYRLEMGTDLKTKKFKDLYDYWGDKPSESLGRTLDSQKEKVIINLASNEYFRVLEAGGLKHPVINCKFLDEKDGEYKFITVYGKRARGMMARFMLKHRIVHAEDLKAFDSEGYHYNHDLSKENDWVFTR